MVKLRAGGRIGVHSAGSSSSDAINPAVIEAMAELGVDMAQEAPKPITDEAVRAADVVITMGCGDACPTTRASDTKNGSSMTLPARICKPSDGSAMRSIAACSHSWEN
jgi:protein-tyrosine-phosphatase